MRQDSGGTHWLQAVSASSLELTHYKHHHHVTNTKHKKWSTYLHCCCISLLLIPRNSSAPRRVDMPSLTTYNLLPSPSTHLSRQLQFTLTISTHPVYAHRRLAAPEISKEDQSVVFSRVEYVRMWCCAMPISPPDAGI
jgi:hypothetical protein